MKQDPSSKKLSDLPVRSLVNGISALILGVFIFLAAIPPLKILFVLLLAGIASVAVWEYFQLLKRKDLSPPVTVGVLTTVLYLFAVFGKTHYASLFNHLPSWILGFFLFICFIVFAVKRSSPIFNISTSFLGIIYIAVPLGVVLKILYFPWEGSAFEGSWWLLYTIAVTKSADMGGYFVGRRYGKRKLAGNVSPNKTIEGAIGGLIASLLISIVIFLIGKMGRFAFNEISLWHAVWLGILLGALGQMGDLAESLLKRDAGVKDSNKLPAVGGILDMIDSLLFTAPCVFVFLNIYYLKSAL